IYVICYPSKCSHMLQPLDVAVFAHIQSKWKNHCDDLMDNRIRITRYNVIEEYMAIQREVMTPDLIRTAFRKSGLYPLNPD
ncbi:hypothetical protein PUNSTDRAFT_29972, partial [Punctularia strigosozonata HHB-11173 SS5]|uniref:uncharacterized protein n=1 Tax=Punctularia strigosozonata (strain HHB-11173) TaxID=741275 RepID=UPI000441854D